MSYRLLSRGVLRLSDNLRIVRGMPEWQEYRAWCAAGNIALPMQAAPAPVPSLAEARRARIQAVSGEALARIQAVLPEVSNMATAQLVRELWLSIAPAARQPTAKMGQVIAIYSAWAAALADIKQCDSAACVANVTVAWP